MCNLSIGEERLHLCWDGSNVCSLTNANYPSAGLNFFPRQGPVNRPVTSSGVLIRCPSRCPPLPPHEGWHILENEGLPPFASAVTVVERATGNVYAGIVAFSGHPGGRCWPARRGIHRTPKAGAPSERIWNQGSSGGRPNPLLPHIHPTISDSPGGRVSLSGVGPLDLPT